MLTRTWSRVDFAGFQPGPDQVPRRERQTFPHCTVREGYVSKFNIYLYICIYVACHGVPNRKGFDETLLPNHGGERGERPE